MYFNADLLFIFSIGKGNGIERDGSIIEFNALFQFFKVLVSKRLFQRYLIYLAHTVGRMCEFE